jgi:hypothetical protein
MIWAGLRDKNASGGFWLGPIDDAGSDCGGCSGELDLEWFVPDCDTRDLQGGEPVGCGEDFVI